MPKRKKSEPTAELADQFISRLSESEWNRLHEIFRTRFTTMYEEAQKRFAECFLAWIKQRNCDAFTAKWNAGIYAHVSSDLSYRVPLLMAQATENVSAEIIAFGRNLVKQKAAEHKRKLQRHKRNEERDRETQLVLTDYKAAKTRFDRGAVLKRHAARLKINSETLRGRVRSLRNSQRGNETPE
jgi:hypothetical protein